MAFPASLLAFPPPRVARGRRAAPATGFPLRDWKRAFAIVDRLNEEFRGAAWFRGIRAFWDGHSQEIAIEVQVRGPARAAAIPADLRGRAIRFCDAR